MKMEETRIVRHKEGSTIVFLFVRSEPDVHLFPSINSIPQQIHMPLFSANCLSGLDYVCGIQHHCKYLFNKHKLFM